MGIYLGHSAVRRVVMANVARVASDAELEAMAEVVRREAPLTLGLSTGLVYNPAVYCDQRELTALVRAFNGVKPGALFPHLRSESDAIIGSVKEVVEAAVDGGGGYCNEHSKIAGAQNYDRIGELESILADAVFAHPDDGEHVSLHRRLDHRRRDLPARDAIGRPRANSSPASPILRCAPG